MKKSDKSISTILYGIMVCFTICMLVHDYNYFDILSRKVLIVLSSFLCTIFITNILVYLLDYPEISLYYKYKRVSKLGVLTFKEKLSYYGLLFIEFLIHLIVVISLYQLVITFVLNHSNILYICLWLLLYALKVICVDTENAILNTIRDNVIQLNLENAQINGKSIKSETLYKVYRCRLPSVLQTKLDILREHGLLYHLEFSMNSYYTKLSLSTLYDKLEENYDFYLKKSGIMFDKEDKIY